MALQLISKKMYNEISGLSNLKICLINFNCSQLIKKDLKTKEKDIQLKSKNIKFILVKNQQPQ